MKKVILYIAASLDHYIALRDGSVEWLNAPEYQLGNEDYGYKNFYNSIDTILMGHNTYKVIRSFDIPFPYHDKVNYVLTRAENNKDNNEVKFIGGDIVSFVKKLKKEKGRKIWLMGGGKINTLMLKNGLIDKVILTLIPIILGDGIPLFDGVTRMEKFYLEGHQAYENGLIQLRYEKKPS